ncbi:mitochondrial inner membrane translocase complex, subunit Tim21 [Pseudohyphozyma bogoriensis]|nr:mitochondrial inner membrane translocase complex, subunit Tim21 [Pseudohyphozyma bogoriensis]
MPPRLPASLTRRLLLERAAPGSASGSFPSDDTVGPFPLPPGGGGATYDREGAIRDAQKSWKQLKGREKMGKVWTQASSLVVVLVGGGIAGLVLFSTGSELASPNSPTNIFEDCVERVKASQELNSLLLPPLTFHGTTSSSSRMRRNRRVSHALTTDPRDGLEVLVVKFWVEGKEPVDPNAADTPWDTVKKWVGPLIWEDSRDPGSYVPRPSEKKAEVEREREIERARREREERERKVGWGEWVGNGVASMFRGLVPRGVTKDGREISGASGLFKKKEKPKQGEFSSGECVAELKKDPKTNNFVYQQLYVDVPDSRHPNHYRVYISTDVIEGSRKGWDRLRFWHTKPPAL